jgi:hypothetical protein
MKMGLTQVTFGSAPCAGGYRFQMIQLDIPTSLYIQIATIVGEIRPNHANQDDGWRKEQSSIFRS